MRIFSFAFLLGIQSLCAQNVTFADPAFKSALIDMGVDQNQDNEIQVLEALAQTSLDFFNYSFTNVSGLEAFTNVKTLEFEEIGGLQTLSVSGLSNVETVKLSYLLQLNSFQLQGFSNLKKITVTICYALKEADFTGFPNVEEIYLIDNPEMTFFNCSNLPKLRVLDTKQNVKVVQPDLTGTKNIEVFSFFDHSNNVNQDYYVDDSWTKLREWKTGGYETVDFKLPNLPLLEKIDLGTLPTVDTLDFSIYPKLKGIRLSYMNKVARINTAGLSELKDIEFYSLDDLRELSLINHTKMENVRIEFLARVKKMNFDHLDALKTFVLHNFDRLEYLSLTNSGFNQPSMEIFTAPKCAEVVLDNLGPKWFWISSIGAIKTLNCNTIYNLEELRIGFNEALETLYIKNGISEEELKVYKNLKLNYVCTDHFDSTRVREQLILDNITNCQIVSDCSTASTDFAAESDEEIQVYPTLVEDVISVSAPSAINAIQVIDVNGRRIFEKQNIGSNHFQLNANFGDCGVYYVLVQTTDSNEAVKILKH